MVIKGLTIHRPQTYPVSMSYLLLHTAGMPSTPAFFCDIASERIESPADLPATLTALDILPFQSAKTLAHAVVFKNKQNSRPALLLILFYMGN